jgi:Zn-finger nucleic acid-binding protein
MCPRCAQASLVELPYMAGEALRVDWCPSCRGAWLDAGELPKVELLATRFESYVSRLQRTISELQQAGYSILHIRNPDDAR